MSRHRGPLGHSLSTPPSTHGFLGWVFSWLFLTPIISPKGMKHQGIT